MKKLLRYVKTLSCPGLTKKHILNIQNGLCSHSLQIFLAGNNVRCLSVVRRGVGCPEYRIPSAADHDCFEDLKPFLPASFVFFLPTDAESGNPIPAEFK